MTKLPKGKILMIAIISVLAACSTTHHLALNTIQIKASDLKALPYIQSQVKQDTIPKHKMTPTELQAYLMPFYKANYDNFFAPEFNRMNKVINAQATTLASLALSNHQLTEVLTNMRLRSIKRIDSMNAVHLVDKKEIDKWEQYYFNIQKTQETRDKAQIDKLKDVTNILLVIGVIMILTILGLMFWQYVQWNRLNKLYQTLENE